MTDKQLTLVEKIIWHIARWTKPDGEDNGKCWDSVHRFSREIPTLKPFKRYTNNDSGEYYVFGSCPKCDKEYQLEDEPNLYASMDL